MTRFNHLKKTLSFILIVILVSSTTVSLNAKAAWAQTANVVNVPSVGYQNLNPGLQCDYKKFFQRVGIISGIGFLGVLGAKVLVDFVGLRLGMGLSSPATKKIANLASKLQIETSTPEAIIEIDGIADTLSDSSNAEKTMVVGYLITGLSEVVSLVLLISPRCIGCGPTTNDLFSMITSKQAILPGIGILGAISSLSFGIQSAIQLKKRYRELILVGDHKESTLKYNPQPSPELLKVQDELVQTTFVGQHTHGYVDNQLIVGGICSGFLVTGVASLLTTLLIERMLSSSNQVVTPAGALAPDV